MPLTCDEDADQLPRLPLVSGRRNRWTIAMRAPTRAAAVAAVPALFQRWHGIMGGNIGEPEVLDQVPPSDTLPTPPALDVRQPIQLVGVEFDYQGPSSMRWPTLVQRRRERVDPLCPVNPVDAMVVGISTRDLPPLEGDDLVKSPREANEDPFGIDLPDVVDHLVPSAPSLAALGLLGAAAFAFLFWLSARR